MTSFDILLIFKTARHHPASHAYEKDILIRLNIGIRLPWYDGNKLVYSFKTS